MKRAHTVEAVRTAEHALMARLPEGALMQRAAFGLASACTSMLEGAYGARIVVLAGSGDNGGDALWAGARLARRGAAVTAILLSSTAHAEGLAALRAAGGTVAESPEAAIAHADLVIDGIVGIGGRPGLRENALQVVDLVEAYGKSVVAVDIPSGIGVDTGETPERHVKADLTVTFGTYKIGHLVDPAAAACGAVELVDIGLDDELGEPDLEALQDPDVRELLPWPARTAQKYSRGVLGVLAGSQEYTGAAVLAVGGALAGFLGMVRYVGPPEPADLVRQAWPAAVLGAGRVQAWLVGSGLGSSEERASEAREVFASGLPVVVDADGLRHIPARFEAPALLTPHEGELARMLEVERTEVEARRLHYATEAARRFDATVLLKGATTVVAAPDGRVRVNSRATPWLATAGSGDVLAGVCGSLLASGLSPLDAGSVGAYLHGTAGLLASEGGPIQAYDLIFTLPDAIRSVVS